MTDQRGPAAAQPDELRPDPPPRRSCLWWTTIGCAVALVVLSLLILLVIWLVKFVWDLRIDQWF